MSNKKLRTDNGDLTGRNVMYRTGLCEWFEGVVLEHDIESGRLTVRDTDDGSRWKGHEDDVEFDAD